MNFVFCLKGEPETKEIEVDKKGQEPAPELIVVAPQKQEGEKQLVSGRVIAIDLGKGVEMEFVCIPSGKFVMGIPPSEECPAGIIDLSGRMQQHWVEITKEFYLGKYQVTQEQYEVVMGKNPSFFKKRRNFWLGSFLEGAKNPVETISWYDAMEFCYRLSEKVGEKFRLPTEAEWEYACRAGTNTAYSWGDKFELNKCNVENGTIYNRNARVFRKRKLPRESTVPVGSFPPNAFGIYDMHGNVWEWCSDWADRRYYVYSPHRDPKGPEAGRLFGAGGVARILRGGSWARSYSECRSGFRYWRYPNHKHREFGFRCVLDRGE